MTPEAAQEILNACRNEIDEIDRQLVALLNARTRVVTRIGDAKQAANLSVYEPKREDMVYANVAGANTGPMPQDSARRIFERIMDEMRTIQRNRMLEKSQVQEKGS